MDENKNPAPEKKETFAGALLRTDNLMTLAGVALLLLVGLVLHDEGGLYLSLFMGLVLALVVVKIYTGLNKQK